MTITVDNARTPRRTEPVNQKLSGACANSVPKFLDMVSLWTLLGFPRHCPFSITPNTARTDPGNVDTNGLPATRVSSWSLSFSVILPPFQTKLSRGRNASLVALVDLRLKRSRVRISAVPLSAEAMRQPWASCSHPCAPFSPSSIIWYQSRGDNALQLRR